MANDTKSNQNRFWLVVALGIGFLILAGGAAFLTGYLLGDRDSGALVALAIISAVVTGIGVAILLLVALLFHRKAKK